MKDLLIILTARCGSDRFPNKVLAEVEGLPLIYWIGTRLKDTENAQVVIATTTSPDDDPLVEIAEAKYMPIYRHPDPDDVVGRMTAALELYGEGAKYIFRALGDSPFIATEILDEAIKTLEATKSDAFLWMLPPEVLPVYGAREFPYSIAGWHKINRNAKGEEREHVDMWFSRNRNRFKIAYHDPPDSVYFRTYRLEVDWPEDLELVRRVAKEVGMLAPLSEINRYIDNNPDVARLNIKQVEKTGPTISYNYRERRAWFKLMQGVPVVAWDGSIWDAPDEKATPIFCSSGKCLVGYGWEGELHTKEGHRIKGFSRISCSCGTGKVWRSPIKKG